MHKTRTVELGPHFEGFIAQQVAAGEFASASEVVRKALTLLERRQAKLTALRAAIAEGEATDERQDRDGEAVFDDLRARLARHG